MDQLTGSAWVRFVTECLDDITRGQRLFGYASSIIVIRNRWSFVGASAQQHYNAKRTCIANDNAGD